MVNNTNTSAETGKDYSPNSFTFLSAEDEYPISGTFFEPITSKKKLQDTLIVIIAGATGVPQTFYYPYARFVCNHGCMVYTFDYRGIGQSKPIQGLKHFQASIVPEWKNDLLGLHQFIKSVWKNTPIVLIGHSVGGHLAPLIPQVSRFLFIGVGTAYVHQMDLPFYKKLVFSGLGPTLATLVGYFPSPTLGLGEALPAGVGIQWSTWSRSRWYHTQLENIKNAFTRSSTPILSLLYHNDTFCTPANALDFLSFLPNCSRSLYLLPQPLGHMNFFRASSESQWLASLPWILNGLTEFNKQTPWVHAEKGVGGFFWADEFKRKNPPNTFKAHL